MLRSVFSVGSNAIGMGRPQISVRASKVAKPRAFLGQIVTDVAVAPQHLDGAVAHLQRDARRLPRGQRRFAGGVAFGVEAPRRLPHEQAGGVDLDGHVGELERDRLLGRDRGAEGLALLGVVTRDLERGARDAHRRRRQPDAAAVDDLAVIDPRIPAQPGGRGDAHAVEAELHGGQGVDAHVLLRRRAESGGAARHEEGLGDVSLAGDDDHALAALEPGDEALLTRERVAVAVAAGPRLRVEGVEVQARLHQREGAGDEARAREGG
jgi:hypothetical protein